MNIVCVIGGFAFGGAEHVMTNIVNHLSKKHSVVYIAVHHRDEIAYEIDDNVKVMNGIGMDNKLDAVLKLRKTILAQRPDVVLSFLTHINVSVLMAMVGTGVPVVVSERNDPATIAGNVRRFLRKMLYPLASGIVFQTKEAQNYFAENIRKKSVIIPNPIFVSEENIQYRPEVRRKEIVAVGRLEKQKNFPLLIHAYKSVCDAYPDYRLLIYGEGGDRSDLERLITEEGLSEKVVLCGQRTDLHDCIRDASLFVMSSDHEGMPNALMEAMAIGLPCISTDCPVGGPRFLIRDGENGMLVGVKDQIALSGAIKYMLDNREEAEAMGKNARNIMTEMAPSVILSCWEDYLIHVANKR